MGEVRSFIGVQLDDEIHEKLGSIIDKLKETRADVRWVKPGNIHITLKFLGNVDTGKIDEVKDMLMPLGGRKPFSVEVRGVDVLPNSRYPRVVYAAITDNVKPLQELNLDIEDALAPMGFEKEKRDFLPHLTLGRVKSFRAKSILIMKLREFHKKEIGRIAVKSFSLIKSELLPKGAVYTNLAVIELSEGEKE